MDALRCNPLVAQADNTPTYTTTIGYNTRGEITQVTYLDSTVIERTYTDRGQLYQLKHASTTIDTRTYDNGGRMTASSYNFVIFAVSTPRSVPPVSNLD